MANGARLYVGNLSFHTTEESVRELFAQDGRTVVEVKLVTDRETGQPRGFGFVEMGSPQDAQAAIAACNGQALDGRTLKVSEAQERSGGGGGGGGGRGGRGGGGGRRWWFLVGEPGWEIVKQSRSTIVVVRAAREAARRTAKRWVLRKGQRVVRLCTDRTGRYVSSHVWTIVRVSRRDNLILIADKHGPSRWTYDLEGHQRERGAFVSQLVELRDWSSERAC